MGEPKIRARGRELRKRRSHVPGKFILRNAESSHAKPDCSRGGRTDENSIPRIFAQRYAKLQRVAKSRRGEDRRYKLRVPAAPNTNSSHRAMSFLPRELSTFARGDLFPTAASSACETIIRSHAIPACDTVSSIFRETLARSATRLLEEPLRELELARIAREPLVTETTPDSRAGRRASRCNRR